jgi:hypothetical protein
MHRNTSDVILHLRVSLSAREFHWVPKSFIECPRVSLSAREFHWVPESFNECPRILMSAQEFQWLHKGFNECTRVSLSPIGPDSRQNIQVLCLLPEITFLTPYDLNLKKHSYFLAGTYFTLLLKEMTKLFTHIQKGLFIFSSGQNHSSFFRETYTDWIVNIADHAHTAQMYRLIFGLHLSHGENLLPPVSYKGF